ncbi:MAG: hypothetical protein JXB32_16705 [Deltaproteobacteria bacterium]|nr:hypothetical protein [Deltaproteobacteria bacterium]
MFNRNPLFFEQVLEPGSEVSVFGSARRDPSTGQLVLRSGEGEAGDLTLTSCPRADFVARERTGLLVPIIALALGASLGLAALVLFLLRP